MNAPTIPVTPPIGIKTEITFLNGNKEEVIVAQLPVRKMQEFADAQGDESKMIELVTGMKPESVDLLTPDSHVALVAESEKVNQALFLNWARRMQARAEKLKGEIMPLPVKA
jgi:hypothetical protein